MQVVELVKRHVDPKVFWKLPIELQKEVLQNLFTDICKLYDVNDVRLEIKIDPILYCMSGGGCFVPTERKIYLYKISLMTFLHEIGHMLLGPSEEKARLWSHKIFYAAFPKLYMKNVQEGKFFHKIPLEKVEKFNECLK
jgi:Zn-dependent M32 family carboxypeptidase